MRGSSGNGGQECETRGFKALASHTRCENPSRDWPEFFYKRRKGQIVVIAWCGAIVASLEGTR